MSKVAMFKAYVSKVDLSKVDMSKVDMSKIDLSKTDLSKICCCAEKALDGESRKKLFFGWYVSDVWWKWTRKNQKVEHWGKRKIKSCFQSQFEIHKTICDIFWCLLNFVRHRKNLFEAKQNFLLIFGVRKVFLMKILLSSSFRKVFVNSAFK